MSHGFERIQEVLEEVGRKIKARDEQALRFNFLKMLGRSDNELTHSRILAFLLNPSEHHGQGTRFLRNFLETFVEHNKLPQDLEKVSVITEEVIGESGRLDILLCLPDRHWIVIENKVNAQEGPEQVERYMKSFDIQGEKTTLIFLTPKGRQPQNVSSSFDKNRIKCRSYDHLAKWLEHLQLSDRPMPDRLGVVLEQCREAWKIISNPTVEVSMTDEILECIRIQIILRLR